MNRQALRRGAFSRSPSHRNGGRGAGSLRKARGQRLQDKRDIKTHGLRGRNKSRQAGQVSVKPPQPQSSEAVNQRTAFVGAAAVVLALAALTLWSAQAWRLPWQQTTEDNDSRDGKGDVQDKPVEDIVHVELAAIVDDQHTWDSPSLTQQDRDLEVKRLQAARVALERRLGQLSGSKDRRSGIPTPYVPQTERPWREKGYQEALAEALKAGVAIDPSADMSLQWEDEASQQTAFSMQQELLQDQRPLDEITKEEEELQLALQDIKDQQPEAKSTDAALPDLTEAAGEQEEAVLPKGSDQVWREGVTTADLASRRPEELRQQTEDTDANAEAEDAQERAQSQGEVSQDKAGLPDLSISAEGSKEGSFLPTPSATTFTDGLATTEERSAAANGVSISQTEFVRRSQKPVPKVRGQLRIVAAGASAPAPHKMEAGQSGEDAFFVSEALWGGMGVADGVGSWTRDGVDPSLFSRRLMEVAAAATEHGWGRSRAQGARGLLHIAQIGAIDVRGTSTVCIAQMMSGQTLQVANLGDSGFRILRDGKCIFASEVQRHSFNCPYQAGSPKLHPHTNSAKDAEVYELDLKENDMVLMATDGIYDNLWDSDLEQIVTEYIQEVGKDLDSGDAAALATRIVGEASRKGSDPEASTPWIVETAKEKPELLPWNIRLRPRGGKPDDCTAVIAFLQGDEKQY